MAGADVSSAAAQPALRARIQVALGPFDLDVASEVPFGEVLAVLGPNGAGKTTLLRAVAGLVPLAGGRISVAGSTLSDPTTGVHLPPEDRHVGVVFQELLLFPHLSALDNVAFGLRCRGTAKAMANEAARSWLDRLGLAEHLHAKPDRLSGGQAQRVALARALATEPKVLLLDEPLAALDAGTVGEVRRELRRYLGAFGGATIVVTHDPLDALALASRVMVLEHGRVTQAGSIADVTTRPTTRYVADLIGVNLLRGVASGTSVTLPGGAGTVALAEPAHGDVHVLIRPHAVSLHTRPPDGSPRNQWPARVSGFDLLGDRVRVRLTGAVPLVAEITPAAVSELGIAEGGEVWAAVKATEVVTYLA